MSKDERLIETAEGVQHVIEVLRPASVVTVDTEFLWERTYLPKLALVQVAVRDGERIHGFAVDPLAVEIRPLLELLAEPGRLKVMHAGRLDQQIMNRILGAPLAPAFDTQRAAALLGYGAQIGYANLALAVLGEQLKKGEQYTDWTRRPLRDSQVEYALGDVIPLVEVYEALVVQLNEKGRLDWVEEEMASLVDPATYADTPDGELYQKVKRYKTLDRRGLGVLREIVTWREREARKRDWRPRFVVKDPTLLELANRRPKTVKALKSIRGLHKNEVKQSGEAIVRAVKKAMQLSTDQLPPAPKKTKRPRNVDAAVDLLRAYLAKRSGEIDVAAETLATTSELEKLARDSQREKYKNDHPILLGWRGELVGKDMQRILNGELTLGVDPTSAELRLVDPQERAASDQ